MPTDFAVCARLVQRADDAPAAIAARLVNGRVLLTSAVFPYSLLWNLGKDGIGV
jgi:hypothetical protein